MRTQQRQTYRQHSEFAKSIVSVHAEKRILFVRKVTCIWRSAVPTPNPRRKAGPPLTKTKQSAAIIPYALDLLAHPIGKGRSVMTQTTQFKVAAVQMAPVQNDTDATIDKVVGYIGEAADASAKVIGFPEAIIPGYPWWIWMDGPIQGMDLFCELYSQAVEIPSVQVARLSQAAVTRRPTCACPSPRRTGAACTSRSCGSGRPATFWASTAR